MLHLRDIWEAGRHPTTPSWCSVDDGWEDREKRNSSSMQDWTDDVKYARLDLHRASFYTRLFSTLERPAELTVKFDRLHSTRILMLASSRPWYFGHSCRQQKIEYDSEFYHQNDDRVGVVT